MNNVSEAVLHECLALLEQGEAIEQIITRYPELAAEIRPFLETTAQLATLVPQPSLAAKQSSQKAFLAHAAGLKVTPVRPSAWYRLRQALLPLVSLAVVLILFAITAVSVSASAIPGDALYSVKRLVETVRLNQTSDPTAAAALIEQYRQERIREVQTLLRTRRSAEVTFVGEVEAIQPEMWTVAAIPVTLNAQTSVEGQQQVGETARVNGRTAGGVLLANTIEILTNAATPPDPTVTPEPTVLPSVTATMTPTEEATTKPTADPTATITVSATPTLQPTATSTPSPTPTATVPPADNNDDDGSDNGTDNGNDSGSNDNGDSNDDGDHNDNDGNNNNGDSNDNGDHNDNDGHNNNGEDGHSNEDDSGGSNNEDEKP
jgi:hypothetical protein